jgi:integrase
MMRLYVVLGVFAGLRPEEAQRLRWEDINFEDECIVISKMRSKTSRPRVIPFEPSFKAWLCTIACGSAGPVYNQKNHRNQFDRLLAAAGMKKSDWIQDGLRHTYGSARWLIDKDMYQLARHMGNSERVCVDHYLSTSMTKATAQALFAIMPLQSLEGPSTKPEKPRALSNILSIAMAEGLSLEASPAGVGNTEE